MSITEDYNEYHRLNNARSFCMNLRADQTYLQLITSLLSGEKSAAAEIKERNCCWALQIKNYTNMGCKTF